MRITIDVGCSDETCGECFLLDDVFGTCRHFSQRSDADWESHRRGRRLEECVEATVEVEIVAPTWVCEKCESPATNDDAACPWCLADRPIGPVSAPGEYDLVGGVTLAFGDGCKVEVEE